MSSAKYTRVRVYQSLRSAHLERAHQLVNASIIFDERRYDFDDGLTSGLDLIEARGATMIGVLTRSRISALEINEPLQRPGLARTAAAVATARMVAMLRRRPLVVVTYAIENRDPFGPHDSTRSAKQKARFRVDRILSRYVARQVDRIAFGTDSSRDLYEFLRSDELQQADAVTIEAVPAPCDCQNGDARSEDLVTYLGALEPRKGFTDLLAAWPKVLEQWPSARLSIIGKGSHEAQARIFADEHRSVSLVVDPPRTDIHRLLRRSAALVLLSQSTPNWREQVGLPIVEGLAHGCSIVTTQETGLARWLEAHDHTVIRGQLSTETIADAIVGALRRRRSSVSVLAELPSVDGRLSADEWLFAGTD